MIKSESMLCNNPDKITRFSHSVVSYYLVLGACGIQESDVKMKGTAANCVALASVIMCRLRNTKASALHDRFLLYCQSSRLNPCLAGKVNAFYKQASNASSHPFWHSGPGCSKPD